MTAALADHVTVRMLVEDDAMAEHVRYQCRHFGIAEAAVELHIVATNDLWLRDSGPIFVKDRKGGLVATDWNFNGWGGRMAYGRDRQVAEAIAGLAGVPRVRAAITTEGGAIEVNGKGTLLATRSSIVNGNRNPNWSGERIEEELKRYLGQRHVIWLSGADPEVCEALGDDTDWHIDIAARFTNETTVVHTWTDDANDPRKPHLDRHRDELAEAVTADGKALTLVALPAPHVAKISEQTHAGGGATRMTDAAYANYLVTNGLVLVPVFGHPMDDRAIGILREQFPGREIVRIPCVTLTEEGGAVHCVTQQQPAAG